MEARLLLRREQVPRRQFVRQPRVAPVGVDVHAERAALRDAVERRHVLQHCAGREPPFLAAKRPPRPHKSAIQNRCTVDLTRRALKRPGRAQTGVAEEVAAHAGVAAVVDAQAEGTGRGSH